MIVIQIILSLITFSAAVWCMKRTIELSDKYDLDEWTFRDAAKLVGAFGLVLPALLFLPPWARYDWFTYVLSILIIVMLLYIPSLIDFWFGSPAQQAARKEREAQEQQQQLQSLIKDAPSPSQFALECLEEFVRLCIGSGLMPPPLSTRNLMRAIAQELYSNDFSSPDTGSPNQAIQLALETKTVTRQQVLDIFKKHLLECFLIYARALPPDDGGPLRVPVTSIIDVPNTVRAMCTELWQISPKTEYGLFGSVYKIILDNYWRVSRAALSEKALAENKRIYPTTFEGTADELVQAYFVGTPFLPLFDVQVSLPLGTKRFEHQFVVAPSGSGKTMLLQAQIADDLKKVEAGEASLVIIDSQGAKRADDTSDPTLIENLIGLKIFAKGQPLHGKLLYIKPNKDLALNVFDMGQDDADLDDEDRQRRDTATREMIGMCLSSETLIQHQMLMSCIRLAMLMPNPTIRTIRRMLNTDAKQFPIVYKDALDKANVNTREYFLETFSKSARSVTKDALLLRIDGMLNDETFAAMVDRPTNQFHMLKEIEAGKVIVIDADKGLLGANSSEAFGRFFIALLLHASWQRTSSKPVYCYIDECHTFISTDENIETMLGEARKRKVGLILATLSLEKIVSPKVRDALLNVAILAAGRNSTDASQLARLMQTEPETIAKQRTGTFAFFVKDKTPNGAVQVNVPGHVMEKMLRMTPEEFAEVHPPKKREPPHSPAAPTTPPDPPSRPPDNDEEMIH